VAGKLIARGEVVVVLGEKLGVRITELVKPT
jgi:flagellar motor switch/type III secretory pathway protein FliN